MTKPGVGNSVGKFTTITHTLKEGDAAKKRFLGPPYKWEYSYIKKKDNAS